MTNAAFATVVMLVTVGLLNQGQVQALPLGTPGICPPEHPSARRVAMAFLKGAAYAPDRESLGLAPGDTALAVLLADSTDGATCSALNASIATGTMAEHPWVHSYYSVGAYYLVGFGVAPDAEPRIENGRIVGVLRHSAIAVYDASLNVLMVLGA